MRISISSRTIRPLVTGVFSALICTQSCFANPDLTPWASESAAVSGSVSAAELSGWYSVGETTHDTVEIRDVRQTLQHMITRQDIESLAPWMTLDSSDDGPRAMAWTDSGRSLFIVVTDDSVSPDGLGSDVVLRYDTTTESLSLFARATIGIGSGQGPAAMHYKGELWVTTQSGSIRVYFADRDDTSGSLHYEWALPGGESARGIALARSLDLAFVVSETDLYRVDLTQAFAAAELVGPVTRGSGVAYSDHFGQPWHEGAYVIEGAGGGEDARVLQVPRFQAIGLLPYVPLEYLQSPVEIFDIASTPCGGMLIGGADGPQVLRETEDTRLNYEAWLQDEFDQVVTFAQGLVAPDGEPAGWVIDADVASGGSRFHPPSPDGAAWVVMLHVAKDHIAGDQGSKPIVRDILQRYAGLMPDGIVPQLTSDGIMRHWYDPWTGNVKPGWSTEYATLSTMLLVMSADRARRLYSDDPVIVDSADAIINRVQNWESYIQPGSHAMYFKALESGGPDFGSLSGPFHEGVIFIEQASVYGSSVGDLDFWLDRSQLPESEYVQGFPMTSNWPGNHLPAFVSLYPWIAQDPMRSDPSWESHVRNLLASNGAWTDDNGPDFMTVFSAGTTRSDWGGYHADSLSNHPGDVTTFTSLMGFSSLGETAPSVGAYHAYRHGARQDFASGASMLFRRSNIDPGFSPNDAGLSDVVIGALGLAELLKPGTADAVLAVSYQRLCPADLTGDDVLDFFDISAFLTVFGAGDPVADFTGDGQFDFFDISAFLTAFSAGCP